MLNSTSDTSKERAFELEDDSEETTQAAEQRDKEMENMTDNENMEDRMRKLNIYIITVPEQMNGGEAIFKELRIFQN